MLLILLIISILLILMGVLTVFNARYPDENPLTYIGFTLGIALFIGSGIALIVGSAEISQKSAIENKIEMYKEENENIENAVTIIVENYLQHEECIFEDLNNQSIEILLTIYPEIKSNTIVEAQLQVFIENNVRIKTLKENLFNIETWRWWVYFG